MIFKVISTTGVLIQIFVAFQISILLSNICTL
jgi:hypothetical protein